MKKRIRKTGEIVDVIAYSTPCGIHRSECDSVSYIDSQGGEHVEELGLNIHWDFEDVEEELTKEIDWEGVRIKAAIEAVPVFASVYDRSYKDTAKMAVSQADALIAELKKGGKDES